MAWSVGRNGMERSSELVLNLLVIIISILHFYIISY